MNIIITGEKGFIGYHLTQYLKWVKKENVISVGRDFQKESKKFIEADWVVHLAGVNRGESDQEVYNGNVNLAKDLIEIFDKNESTPNVIFISSIQESLNNIYGNSKIDASKIIKSHCESKNKLFISLKLPNVFGSFCKPNYNSFIATFCDKISKGNNPEIIKDNKVPLIYVQDVCKVLYDSIIQTQEKSFEEYIYDIKVSEALNKLNYFNELYNKNGILPELDNKFNINLFNTFRSYISPLSHLTRKTDDRGYLIEILKCESSQTQMFYSVTKPNITRGNHFHFDKIERFMILKGTALVEMRKIDSEKILSWVISDSDDLTIDMPIMYTHSLKNIGDDDLICCFWTQEIFNPSLPDTYFEKVNLI
jgi:UDP-2-acetamido-2,6-beta-L-arabino-hexul-4-ose reductase